MRTFSTPSMPSIQSTRFAAGLPHGFPLLNMLSRASLAVGWILPSSALMLRRPSRTSKGSRPLGQRIAQVLQVVQSQISGFSLSSSRRLSSIVSLTNFRTLSSVRTVTGHPPVHLPHWIHPRRSYFCTNLPCSILMFYSKLVSDKRWRTATRHQKIDPQILYLSLIHTSDAADDLLCVDLG